MENKDKNKAEGKEKRKYLRHLLVSPLKFKVDDSNSFEETETVNVSEGGLMFTSRKDVPQNSMIELHMPLYSNVYKIKSKVVHVEKDEDADMFNVGVVFTTYSDAFKVKLIEQIYLIEEYRILRSLQTGKEYTIKEASQEWIKRYSDRFEELYW